MMKNTLIFIAFQVVSHLDKSMVNHLNGMLYVEQTLKTEPNMLQLYGNFCLKIFVKGLFLIFKNLLYIC